MRVLSRVWLLVAVFGLVWAGRSYGRQPPLIDQALNMLPALERSHCKGDPYYHVYLIDNFDQEVELVPELSVSHGDLVRAFLLSGREDIRVRSFNMSLGRGLARAILDVQKGECVDGVVSAVPGSNYSYAQVATILATEAVLDDGNILDYREELRKKLLSIARRGFPSLEWLLQLDVNPAKLREDARKIALIETLAEAGIPVYLPYGNRDTLHRGQLRSVNLLGVARGVQIYSGLDMDGERISGYPYSPLSSGSAVARFTLNECPDDTDGLTAHLDVNEDGHNDFTYRRNDLVAFSGGGHQSFYAPPPLSEPMFAKMLGDKTAYETLLGRPGGVVLSSRQYRRLALSGLFDPGAVPAAGKQLVWLNSDRHGPVYSFNPACRIRGSVEGSSFIPPLKIKEQLVPRGDG